MMNRFIHSKGFRRLAWFIASTALATLALFIYVMVTTPAGDFRYKFIDDQRKAIVITAYKGSDAEVTIPNAFDGAPVTVIGENAFKRNGALEKVIIPEGVETIGNSAFEQCEALKEVHLPASLTLIDYSAFFSCAKLEKVVFGNPETAMKSGVFEGDPLLLYQINRETDEALLKGVDLNGVADASAALRKTHDILCAFYRVHGHEKRFWPSDSTNTEYDRNSHSYDFSYVSPPNPASSVLDDCGKNPQGKVLILADHDGDYNLSGERLEVVPFGKMAFMDERLMPSTLDEVEYVIRLDFSKQDAGSYMDHAVAYKPVVEVSLWRVQQAQWVLLQRFENVNGAVHSSKRGSGNAFGYVLDSHMDVAVNQVYDFIMTQYVN